MKLLSKKFYAPLLTLLLLVLVAGCGSMKNTEQDLVSDAQDARNTIMMDHPNAAEMFNEAEAYAIFPNVGKGAYIIGGASGNGVVYQNGNVIGYSDLKQVDIGLQAGGKSFIEVVFFEDQGTLERFKEGTYELDANASAVILEKGVSRNLEFQDGVSIVTVPKAGAMAGISVGGQRFTFQPRQ
ncbi:lipid-binding SYLF domain-containing protein [Antarcticibacterium sp. 1MA-6-2]|uniref:lipid-binding SYLF domain-containing protein n=1 Tax=Antarcticibacterium sp. 1MA-6-2 TaxID=2908210 RepID=UPI001F46E5D7|nr:lipid-binding SYLF domain-containing protein [Antarcticibacterium sp. 1MA-6-2]UJH90362.1 lipid-binding SYLF domain-containing protein [Antarcticibacterium sp. 1MA-6-2]